jgi:hypothetical protein
MPTATTYTATFSNQYQLTTQASPSADGSVSPASGSYFASGATIPVTATAIAGFTFSNWTSTGEVLSRPLRPAPISPCPAPRRP